MQTRWALGVIDVQNDFCEGGSLAVTGGANVAAGIADLIGASPSRWVARFASQDWHPEGLAGHFASPGTEPDFVDTWPAHCVQETWGSELHPALLANQPAGLLFDAEFKKGQTSAAYSAFEGTEATGASLPAWLSSRAVTGVELAGLATDYCVNATAVDAVRAGLQVRVLLKYCAGISPERVEQCRREWEELGILAVED